MKQISLLFFVRFLFISVKFRRINQKPVRSKLLTFQMRAVQVFRLLWLSLHALLGMEREGQRHSVQACPSQKETLSQEILDAVAAAPYPSTLTCPQVDAGGLDEEGGSPSDPAPHQSPSTRSPPTPLRGSQKCL